MQIARFGHTHKPYLERRGDLTVLNPGSLSFPAPGGQTPSYMLMDLDDEGEAHFTTCYL